MRPTELGDRIKNHPPGMLAQHCASCGDDGMLEVAYRNEGQGQVAEMGPCPFCMKGYRVEFPDERAGVWGKQGYWRGHEIPLQLLRHPSQDRQLPKGEQLVEARKLVARFGAVAAVKPIDALVDRPPEPRVSDEQWFADKPKKEEQ